MTGRIRSRFGPTRLRASLTYDLGPRRGRSSATAGSANGHERAGRAPVAQSRPGADEVERRTPRAGELARRRREPPVADPPNRLVELRFEPRHVLARERRRYDRIRPLEEG